MRRTSASNEGNAVVWNRSTFSRFFLPQLRRHFAARMSFREMSFAILYYWFAFRKMFEWIFSLQEVKDFERETVMPVWRTLIFSNVFIP